MPRRTDIDVQLLHALWVGLVPIADIALRFGVTTSTVQKWQTRYKLPSRRMGVVYLSSEPPPPSPEDDAASLGGLALSPWVEERARECRERHYSERRAEGVTSTQSKTSKWRRGICSPRGVA